MAAEEIKRVIEIDAALSVQTVRQLREEIAKLQSQLNGLEKDTEDYTAVQQKAEAMQQELNETMTISTSATNAERQSVEELRNTINGILGARGDLIQQMVAEKEVLDGVAAQRRALAKEIKAGNISEEEARKIKAQLLEVETTYQTSMSQTRRQLNASTKEAQAAASSYDGLSQTLGRLRSAYRSLDEETRNSTAGEGLKQQIQLLDAELKSIDADIGNYQRNVGNYSSVLKELLPEQGKFVFELGEIATEAGGLPALFKGIGTSIWGMVKAAAAFVVTPLGALLTAVAVAALVVAKNWDKMLGLFGYTSPADQGAAAIEALNEHLDYLDGKLQKLNTGALKKYTEALKEAGGDINKANQALEAYNATLQENALANAEAALEAAYAAEKEAYAAYLRKGNAKTIENLRKAQEAVRESAADVAAAENDIAVAAANSMQKSAEAAKKSAEERLKTAKETADAEAKIVADTLKLTQDLRAQTEESEVLTARENYARDLENFNKSVQEKSVSEEVAAGYREKLAEQTEQNIAEIRQRYRDQEATELANEWDREQEAANQREQIKLGAFERNMNDLDRNAERESLNAEATITDPEQLEQTLRDIQQRLYEAKVGLIDEMLNDEDIALEKSIELSDRKADIEIENGKRVLKEERADAKEHEKIQKAKFQASLDIAQSTLNSLSSILGEETAAGKAAAVAAATIDTYKAANSAYSALAGVPLVGPALGAAAAAAAVVAGIANVKKILSTNTDGSNAASVTGGAAAAPAVVTPPAVIQEVPVIRSLTGAKEEEQVNSSSGERVYVVYSDIEGAGRTVDVQQSESTF